MQSTTVSWAVRLAMDPAWKTVSRVADDCRAECGLSGVRPGGVTSDDGDAIGESRFLHALPDPGGDLIRRSAENVRDRDGAPTHGRDIREIHHDGRVAGEPWITLDEGLQHACGGEEQVT